MHIDKIACSSVSCERETDELNWREIRSEKLNQIYRAVCYIATEYDRSITHIRTRQDNTNDTDPLTAALDDCAILI